MPVIKQRHTNTITLIVVPRSHRQTLNLLLPVPLLIGLAVMLVIGLVTSIGYVYFLNRDHARATAAIEDQTALKLEAAQAEQELRERESQLQQMTIKVQEIETDLTKLRELDNRVRKLIDGNSSSETDLPQDAQATEAAAEPILNTEEETAVAAEDAGVEQLVADGVIATRTAPRERILASRSLTVRRTPADGVLARLESLKGESAQRLKSLAESETNLANRMDYLAHRPTGQPAWGERSDHFGWRWDPLGRGQRYHQGVDYAADWGNEIYATADGVVVFADWKSGGYGLTVIVDHGYGFQTLYAHNSENAVQEGEHVKRGQVLAYVGNTGNSTGPHVHYEVHLWGEPVDPDGYVD